MRIVLWLARQCAYWTHISCLQRIWTAGEPENDARIERTGQGGMKVPVSLQKNMLELREKRPGLKEKYAKFPFE